MTEPLTDAELAKIERTATDLIDAMRLDDSIAGWPEHFDEDFSEALGPEKALRLIAEVRRLREERNEKRNLVDDFLHDQQKRQHGVSDD